MTAEDRKLVSIVVPCCNEEAMIDPFLDRMRRVGSSLPAYAFEYLFVDDGSTDATGSRILEASQEDSRIKLVALSRNFGHQRAITAGLDFCSGEYVVVIDADLQDPPEVIPEILHRLEDGYDLVHMVRESRAVDSFAKRASARAFYGLMRRYVLPELPEDAPDFKGFNRSVLDALRQYRERVRFLRGMFATLGFQQCAIPYRREARHAGRSKYPWKTVIAFARDAMVSYSVIPLRLSLFLGFAALAATLVFLVGCAVRHWAGGGLQEPLHAILIAIVTAFSGLILIVLGLMGEYLGVIVRELKQRPLYVVRSVHNLPTTRRVRE